MSFYKRCPECFETLPFKARICPSCRSFQDWRRYVSIGQINIALLVALLSIATALTALIPQALKDSGAGEGAEHQAEVPRA